MLQCLCVGGSFVHEMQLYDDAVSVTTSVSSFVTLWPTFSPSNMQECHCYYAIYIHWLLFAMWMFYAFLFLNDKSNFM